MIQAQFLGSVRGLGVAETAAERSARQAAERDATSVALYTQRARTAKSASLRSAFTKAASRAAQRVASYHKSVQHAAARHPAAGHPAAPAAAARHQLRPTTPAARPGTPAATVTAADVEKELRGRGYKSVAPKVEVAPPEVKRITKAQAVTIAVDVAIDTYSTKVYVQRYGAISKTRSHPYRCPSGECNIAPTLYDLIVQHAVNLSNYYLRGGTLPSWGAGMLKGLALGYAVVLSQAVLPPMFPSPGATVPAVAPDTGGGFWAWIGRNPEVISGIGAAFNTWGDALSRKKVEETIRNAVPAGMVTKADMGEFFQRLLDAGAIPPGKEQIVADGLRKASVTMPTWAIPLLIGGGIVVAIAFGRARR